MLKEQLLLQLAFINEELDTLVMYSPEYENLLESFIAISYQLQDLECPP